MKLEQSFKVEAPLDQVWEALIDVERVAPCLPGAEVTEAGEDGTYRGNFTVKLGPTTAAYRGELKMESVDEASRRVTMRASGQDKRGQGSAKATIVSAHARGRRRHDGGRGDRLHDHRPARPLRPRRDDPGHLEPDPARVLGMSREERRERAGGERIARGPGRGRAGPPRPSRSRASRSSSQCCGSGSGGFSAAADRATPSRHPKRECTRRSGAAPTSCGARAAPSATAPAAPG